MRKQIVNNSSSNNKSYVFMRLYKVLHFILSVIVFRLFWYLFLYTNHICLPPRYNLFITLLFGLLLVFLTRTYDAYLFEYYSFHDVVFSLSISTSFSVSAVYALTCTAWNKFRNPTTLVCAVIAEILLNTLWGALSPRVFSAFNKPSKTVLIYRTEADLARAMECSRFPRQFSVCSHVCNPQTPDDARSEIDKCEAVFITGIEGELRDSLLRYCAMNNKRCFVLPRAEDVLLMGGSHISAFSIPIMGLIPSKPNLEFLVVKRFFDIILSLAGIVISLPVMLVAAAAVKLCDGGPVFYRQTRLTKNGRKFRIIKFRSMICNAEKDGIARLSSGENDSRITPIGRYLRAFRLDELPQLFNILAGDMSFVGPRPERPEIAGEYEKQIPEFALRLGAKAGLTGYAQVYGKYNTDPYDKLEMDLIYINKMSFLLDLKLLLATFRILFIKESTEGISDNSTNALN